MDLNEKIAARRRELALVAEKERREAEKGEAVESAKLAALEEERRQKTAADDAIRRDAVRAEVTKRLADVGIKEQPVISSAPQSVDWEFDNALTDVAIQRIKAHQKVWFWSLIVFGLFSSFVFVWWWGLPFFIWAVVYRIRTVSRHKKKIVAEGKAIPQGGLFSK